MAGKFWGMQVRRQRLKDGYHIRSAYDKSFLVYRIEKGNEVFVQSFSREDVNAEDESNFLKNFKKVVKKITHERVVDISITFGVKSSIKSELMK